MRLLPRDRGRSSGLSVPRARRLPRLALLAVALAGLPARPAIAAAPPAPALVTLTDALAAELGAPSGDRRSLGLRVDAGVGAEGLRRPLETALAGALARRGWAVAALPLAGDAETEARARGVDWLLRVGGGLVPGRRELALVGEAVPVWRSFFLQRRPGARPAAPRVVQARADADAGTLALARPPRPLDPARVALRALAVLPGRVLALAAGEVEPGATAIVAVRDEGVTLLSARGEPRAELASDRLARRPVRDPAASAAVGDFGGGRIAVGYAGATEAEVLALVDGRLAPVATIPAVPLCAGDAGALYGRFVPGTSALADVLLAGVDPLAGPAPASARRLVGVAAAPRGGAVAYAVLDVHHRLALLDRALAPASAPLDGVGAGFALADLDGDGTAEVVASAAVASGPDRLRILSAQAVTSPVWTSEPLPGLVLAGAAGDLTGDGVDDAVLAAVEPGEDGAPRTKLLLLTADPREAP
jgi:hypothetical protein